MNKKQDKERQARLKALAAEIAKDIKTGEDLSALSADIVKLTTNTRHPGPIPRTNTQDQYQAPRIQVKLVSMLKSKIEIEFI